MMLFGYQYLAAASTIHIVSNRIAGSWEWYVIRAAGFTALGLLILLMLSGIGQVTGFTYRFIEPVKAWAIHKAMAFALCASIAIHVIFLLFDHYIKFTIPETLIPYLSHYNNHTKLAGLAIGSLAISFGILSLYGVTIIVASSLGWINSHKHRWKLIHYISYLVIMLVFMHALLAGTDLRYGLFRFAIVVLAGIVGLSILSRLLRSGALR